MFFWYTCKWKQCSLIRRQKLTVRKLVGRISKDLKFQIFCSWMKIIKCVKYWRCIREINSSFSKYQYFQEYSNNQTAPNATIIQHVSIVFYRLFPFCYKLHLHILICLATDVVKNLLEQPKSWNTFMLKFLYYFISLIYYRILFFFINVLFFVYTLIQYYNTLLLWSIFLSSTGNIITDGHQLPQGDWFNVLSSPHQTAEILMYFSLTVLLWYNITWFFVFTWVLSNQVKQFFEIFTVTSKVYFPGTNHFIESLVVSECFWKLS